MTIDSKEIPLTRGLVAIVSAHRYEELNKYKWYAHRNRYGRYYAVRQGPIIGGKKTTIWMHREILGLGYGDPREGDHADRTKTLDNTDKNIRVATRAQQLWNQGKRLRNTSGYKGVSRIKKKWRAQLGGKHLGVRDTSEAAYFELYVPAALAAHREFFCGDTTG